MTYDPPPTGVAPDVSRTAFNCPNCRAYAQQPRLGIALSEGESFRLLDGYSITMCANCAKPTLWEEQRVVYPDTVTAPPHHPEMPKAIANDYDEAAEIFDRSPRAAAGLLRLVVQKLCHHMGEKGNLNDAIGNLVKKGLDPTLQQSFDIVRVIGNKALHPGEIDINDNRPKALALFSLVNEMVDDVIARPHRVEAIYADLPENARAGIQRRDEPKD